MAIYSLFARAECGLAFVVGASASYFGFIIVIPLVLYLYPLVALGDLHAWRNLDMLYWFAIGWAIGCIL